MPKQPENSTPMSDFIAKLRNVVARKKKKGAFALQGAHGGDAPPHGGLFQEINDLRKPGLNESEDDAAERLKYHDGITGKIASSKIFEFSTLGMICFNAGIIGADAHYSAVYGKPDNLYDGPMFFILVENLFAVYFTLEVLIRFAAYINKIDALFDAWFIFDSCLVTMMVVETWILPFATSGGPLGSLGVLRLLRLLRITRISRIMRAIPEMMVIVKGIGRSSRSVCSTGVLLLILLYTFCILFADAYHEGKYVSNDEEIPEGSAEENFGTMGKSLFSLFIYGTILDDVTYCTTGIRASKDTKMMVFFVIFIIISSFMMLNMLIGVLVEVVSATSDGERETFKERNVREAIAQIFREMDENTDNKICRQEFLKMQDDEAVMNALAELDIEKTHFELYAELFFSESDGKADDSPPRSLSYEELMGMILRLRPGSFVSALDFAAFSKVINNVQDGVKERVLRIENQCRELAKIDGVDFGEGNRSRCNTAGQMSVNSLDSFPPAPGDLKLAGSPVRDFDSPRASAVEDAAVSSSWSSTVRNKLSPADRERLAKTTDQALAEELQRRLSMQTVDLTNVPYRSLVEEQQAHAYSMGGAPQLQEQLVQAPSQAFSMLGVPEDDNDSGTVYV